MNTSSETEQQHMEVMKANCKTNKKNKICCSQNVIIAT